MKGLKLWIVRFSLATLGVWATISSLGTKLSVVVGTGVTDLTPILIAGRMVMWILILGLIFHVNMKVSE